MTRDPSDDSGDARRPAPMKKGAAVNLPPVIPDYSRMFKSVVVPDYSKIFKTVVVPDYSKIFKTVVIPDYSKMLANIVVPNYSKTFKNVVLPDYSKMLADVVLPDYSKLMATAVLPDYAQMVRSLLGPRSIEKLAQAAFDASVAIRDHQIAGAAVAIDEVLGEIGEARQLLEGDLATLGDYFGSLEPDEASSTVGADLALKWGTADVDEPVTLADLYHVMTEQLLVLDAIKDGQDAGPSMLDIYNAVLNTIIMLATIAALLLAL